MTKKKEISFNEQYLTPEWEEVRKRILARDSYTCQMCNEKNTQLDVHHKYYLRDVLLWQYEDSCYETLCHTCHSIISSNQYKVIFGDVIWDYIHGRLKYIHEDKKPLPELGEEYNFIGEGDDCILWIRRFPNSYGREIVMRNTKQYTEMRIGLYEELVNLVWHYLKEEDI